MDQLYDNALSQLKQNGFIISSIYDRNCEETEIVRSEGMHSFNMLYNSVMSSMSEDITVDHINSL